MDSYLLADTMVFGDSLTDISLFQMFPNSALIINPRFEPQQVQILRESSKYASELPLGDGFIQVASHILYRRDCY